MANKRRTTRAGVAASAGTHYPISFVMIVRDEAARLGRCLASVQGLVDEIIVVDTGSSDDTVAIATSYGATIGHFAWVDDFAAARNHALSLATHPWCFFLDADDWIVDREKAAEMLAVLRTRRPEMVCQIPIFQVIESTGALEEVALPVTRILPRGVRYAGRIHEQPDTELPVYTIEIPVAHDGYSAADIARKEGRNRTLLEQALADEPENPYYLYQLGTEHFARNDYAGALPYYVHAYNVLHPAEGNDETPRPWWHALTTKMLLCLIQVEEHEQAVLVAGRQAAVWPTSSELHHLFGVALERRSHELADSPELAAQLYDAALGCWIHAVEQGNDPELSGTFVETGTFLAARALVTAYENLGRPAEAAKYRRLCEPASDTGSERAFPVSAVLIVRDEARRLGRCLESLRGAVDEIVVVDTGSSDDTVAIATSYGATIGHFAWVDDFAAARNHALSLATHPWRLTIDADQWLLDPAAARTALDRVGEHEPTFIGLVGALETRADGSVNDDVEPFELGRLIPRGVSYTGRIHEQPDAELEIVETGLILGHDGYSADDLARKQQRNLTLLETALRDEPENAYLWYQLGSEHAVRGNHAEALPALGRAFNLTRPDDADAPLVDPQLWWQRLTLRLMLGLIAIGQREQAVAVGDVEGPRWPDSADLCFVRGRALRDLAMSIVETDGDRAGHLVMASMQQWQRAVDLGDRREYAGVLAGRATVLAARALAEDYATMGEPTEAQRYRAIADRAA